MILKLAISVTVILLLMLGWILVQHLSRLFAARHPELGPAREEGGSCLLCLCGKNGNCPKKENISPTKDTENHEEAHVH
ncbi:hypothetical protein [Pelagicoccus mobilis]|uniref:Uncharacterized protein n=1 Tax=Pelagicoccus mobilis TaxID=415221 RepID=A0A934RVF5_9BACT|nr:hypothetical protein [Pelagicoccus mobilis]MBK1877547.1 hypothetical protein [Pelagicoccus mobilis]